MRRIELSPLTLRMSHVLWMSANVCSLFHSFFLSYFVRIPRISRRTCMKVYVIHKNNIVRLCTICGLILNVYANKHEMVVHNNNCFAALFKYSAYFSFQFYCLRISSILCIQKLEKPHHSIPFAIPHTIMNLMNVHFFIIYRFIFLIRVFFSTPF